MDRQKLCNKIDDLAHKDNMFMCGFYAGCMHRKEWMKALKGGGNFPKEPRSNYKRLQKHYAKQLKHSK